MYYMYPCGCTKGVLIERVLYTIYIGGILLKALMFVCTYHVFTWRFEFVKIQQVCHNPNSHLARRLPIVYQMTIPWGTLCICDVTNSTQPMPMQALSQFLLKVVCMAYASLMYTLDCLSSRFRIRSHLILHSRNMPQLLAKLTLWLRTLSTWDTLLRSSWHALTEVDSQSAKCLYQDQPCYHSQIVRPAQI